ncbi:MAG TPA: DUF4259 domain-containing protein [Flavobacterium sp.]|nr:DUF4259 domain-containing protein [Flavobacterium sp.]
MGTWGITAFEDDTAMEFYDSFCENGITASEIDNLSKTILNKQYDMELHGYMMDGFDEPSELLVAAEIICASMGKQIPQYPNKEYHDELEIPIINLRNLKRGLSKETISNVISAIRKIQTDKDIHYYILWRESDNFDKWKTYSDDLVMRLQNIELNDVDKTTVSLFERLKGFLKK